MKDTIIRVVITIIIIALLTLSAKVCGQDNQVKRLIDKFKKQDVTKNYYRPTAVAGVRGDRAVPGVPGVRVTDLYWEE